MAASNIPNAELGNSSEVRLEDGVVVKTSTWAGTYDYAEEQRRLLIDYDRQLSYEPIDVADVYDVSVVERGDGLYGLRHTMEYIKGEGVTWLPRRELHEAVTSIIGGIAVMRTDVGDSDRLHVGIDAKVRNWRMGPEKPVLVDIAPSLLRGYTGLLLVNGRPVSNYFERSFGTKSGAMTKVITSALRTHGLPVDEKRSRRYLLRGAEDWCYDALPRDLPAKVSRRIRTDLRLHFLPLIVADSIASTFRDLA
jgi:hypothetical protein